MTSVKLINHSSSTADWNKYVNTITTSMDGETWTSAVVAKDENGGIITTVPSGIIAVPAK